MKVATCAVMAGAVLALGVLIPTESEAFCPCTGTTGACMDPESNPPHGDNGCTESPTGVFLPVSDGKGCIEVDSGEDVDGDMKNECAVCIGGSVLGGTQMPTPARGVQGCLCVRTDDGDQFPDEEEDYVCISLPGDPDPMNPLTPVPVQVTVDYCMANADAGCM